MTHLPADGHDGDAGGIELRVSLAVAAFTCPDLASLTQAMSIGGTPAAGSAHISSQLARSDWWQASGMTEIATVGETAGARHDFDAVTRPAGG